MPGRNDSGNTLMPLEAGYKNDGLYPKALSLIPNAPLTTSLSSGFGTSHDTQSDVSSSSDTFHNFSLNGTMKCLAIPSPRLSNIQSLNDRCMGRPDADGLVNVSINPSKHSRTTSGGSLNVFPLKGYSV